MGRERYSKTIVVGAGGLELSKVHDYCAHDVKEATHF